MKRAVLFALISLLPLQGSAAYCPKFLKKSNASNFRATSAPVDRDKRLASFIAISSHFTRRPGMTSDDLYAYLKEQKQFKIFVKQSNVSNPTSKEKGDLLASYYKSFFDHFQEGADLDLARDRCLAKSLRTRGVHIDSSESGKDALNRISKANLNTALGGQLQIDRSVDKEISDLVEQIEIFFVHSTHALKNTPSEPVLSSRQIEKFGFTGGLNSHRFNKEIMQTDDQVFFRVGFRKKGEPTVEASSYYGDTDLVLDNDFAREHGWISHYVMSQGELTDFGARYLGGKYAEIAKQYESTLIVPSDDTLAEIRDHLSQADFTVKDFETLYKTLLATRLHAWKTQDPARYQKVKYLIEHGIPKVTDEDRVRFTEKLKKLKFSEERIAEKISKMDKPDASRFEDLIKRLVLEPAGLSNNYELKVPVSVPNDRLKLSGSGK